MGSSVKNDKLCIMTQIITRSCFSLPCPHVYLKNYTVTTNDADMIILKQENNLVGVISKHDVLYKTLKWRASWLKLLFKKLCIMLTKSNLFRKLFKNTLTKVEIKAYLK